ncbi:hypothetical protein [Anaeroselena agilis]|uniref:Uncharacterized protein n=1 Tax=Anaeroselena agilis TaxID=3063788 RepID=A0ABU3NUW2_9FIRM|nr:hypothetical protein [Selenomonadales bacterium 4137-cl]
MYRGKKVPGRKEYVYAEGRLTKIGDQTPYFSITGEVYPTKADGTRDRRRSMIACGCIHETILKAWPDLADLVALHLSDIDGQPMHAIENGWYWNGGTKWQAYKRETLAAHLRVSEEEADRVHETCTTKEQFAAYVEAQRPRWKAEAEAAIAKYDLKIKVSR